MHRPIHRRTLLVTAAALPIAWPARAQPAAHRLTVLHINDVHSRHTPVDARAMSCMPGAPACYGSTPRLATAIKRQREAAERVGRLVILLDAGDQFQGSLFYTAHHGMAELAVQHEVGVDAMAVGNHEFDNGPETLAHYLNGARFPVLSANVDAANEPALAGRIAPFTVLDRGGLRIGVIGLTTPETAITSSPGPRVFFAAPAPALAAAAAAARAQGAQVLILLSHLGFPIDRTLPVTDLALIVGGHSHVVLANDEPEAIAPDPSPGGGGTPIVQAGAYARYLGRVDLDMAADGTVLALAAACHHVGLDTPEDPGTAAIVARFAAPLEALRNRPVATLAEPLDLTGCRIGPCRIGTLLAETLRAAAHGAQVGLINAGGIRTGLPAGPITLGQVLEAIPFGNTLATLSLSGAALQEAVQHGFSMTGRGGYPQWAGLRVQLAPPLIEVEQNGAWTPLDPAARYLVATNNFLRSGGDGYTVLRDRAEDAYDTGPPLADLFADALAKMPRP